MHPAIRIVLVVVLAVLLPRLSLAELLLLCGVLAVAALVTRRNVAAPLWRLRWLFAAILVLAWGFTPGDAAWAALPGLSREGLVLGLRQASLLAALIVTVHFLLSSVPPDAVAQGLCWLLRPAGALGLDPERLARRLGGALEALARAHKSLRVSGSFESRIDAAAEALAQIERDAAVERPPARMEQGRAPRWFEWIAPAGLAILVVLA